jgi:hypothetical protein
VFGVRRRRSAGVMFLGGVRVGMWCFLYIYVCVYQFRCNAKMVPPQLSGSDSPPDKMSYRTLHLMNQSAVSKKTKKVLIVWERRDIHSTGSLTWTGLDGKSESSLCRIRTEVELAPKDVSKHFY